MITIVILSLLAIFLITEVVSSSDNHEYRDISELVSLAQNNDSGAQVTLAYYYQHGINVEQDLTKALYWNQVSAANGNTIAMLSMAYLYENGIGVEKNLQKSFQWNLNAAMIGDPTGMLNVSKMYEEGKGINQDYTQAKYWLEKYKYESFKLNESI